MSEGGIRRSHDERGASLILAIAFLVVIGGISAAVVSSVTSGFKARTVLDQVRDREYAADAGVEFAIAQVRAKPLPGPAVLFCGRDATHDYYRTVDYYSALNGFNIRVDCANKRGVTIPALYEQRNVIFTACVDAASPCNDTNAIVRAQVNYEAISAGSVLNVTRTWVQSWSVNR